MTEKGCSIKFNNDESDEESFMSPCFQIPNGIELRDVPTSGEEYLLKVIHERRSYAAIATSDIDCSKFSKNQSTFAEEIPCAKAPESLKPTIEWQNIQVADFSENRLYISRLLENKSQWPKDIERIKFNPHRCDLWKTYFDTYEPTLRYVLGLNQKILDYGLECLINSLDSIEPGNRIPHKTGQWLYAFLAYTSMPLLPDMVNILRNLARKCAEIRSHINPQDDNAHQLATPLNLFICLIGKYFGQFDLAD